MQLPSEPEWEKGKADPDRANYDETGIGSTSTVGCFPSGRSPYDALDLAGNVLEWTCSLHKHSPYDPEDVGREGLTAGRNVRRVLRGVSFNDGDGDLRCASRLGDLPLDLGWDLGFRVVLSPIRSGL